jgi:hypothetical protein
MGASLPGRTVLLLLGETDYDVRMSPCLDERIGGTGWALEGAGKWIEIPTD